MATTNIAKVIPAILTRRTRLPGKIANTSAPSAQISAKMPINGKKEFKVCMRLPQQRDFAFAS
jgi:hypothetical protein